MGLLGRLKGLFGGKATDEGVDAQSGPALRLSSQKALFRKERLEAAGVVKVGEHERAVVFSEDAVVLELGPGSHSVEPAAQPYDVFIASSTRLSNLRFAVPWPPQRKFICLMDVAIENVAAAARTLAEVGNARELLVGVVQGHVDAAELRGPLTSSQLKDGIEEPLVSDLEKYGLRLESLILGRLVSIDEE